MLFKMSAFNVFLFEGAHERESRRHRRHWGLLSSVTHLCNRGEGRRGRKGGRRGGEEKEEGEEEVSGEGREDEGDGGRQRLYHFQPPYLSLHVVPR